MSRDGYTERSKSPFSGSTGGEYFGEGFSLPPGADEVIIEKCAIDSDALAGEGFVVNPDEALTMRMEGVTIRYDDDG